MTTNYADLKEKAEAANNALDGKYFSSEALINVTGFMPETSNFMSAFNPAVALELIARLERAEKHAADFRAAMVQALREENDSWTGDFKHAANLALSSALVRFDDAMKEST